MTLIPDTTATAAKPRTLITPEMFDRLVRRIVKDDPTIEQALAERIMAEALAFLQACALNPGAGLSPAWAVDIGWHTFILHTREYAEFRDRVAGRFIHHAPTDTADQQVGRYGPIAATLAAMREAGIPVDEDLWKTHAANCSQCHAELELAAPAALDGAALLHTDLQPGNILINGDAVTAIDWAWASRGAAWIDPAFLVIRLIAAGHPPAGAEEWAARIPAWEAAPPSAITAFAAVVLGLWGQKTRSQNAHPHSAHLTKAARRWARHRLEIT